jgi:uncharacterized protein (DUF952 family)
VPELIVHIARRGEWEDAKRRGEYEPPSLASEGFIHLSAPQQVHYPANALYSGERELVLLWVDPDRLHAALRYERPSAEAMEAFPHLYGALNVDAVVAESPLDPWERGAFELPPRPPTD